MSRTMDQTMNARAEEHESEIANPGARGATSVAQRGTCSPVLDPAPGLAGSEGEVSALCWFPFYPVDWLGSLTVRGMTYAQKGMYLELLCHQWNEGGALPGDDEFLAKACGMAADHKDFLAALSKFPRNADGLRANARLSEIYQVQSAKHTHRVNSGKKSQNQNQNQIAGALPEQCPSNAMALLDVEARSKKLERPITGGVTPDLDFDAFWGAYPRKTGKKAAFKAWQNAKDKPPLPDILKAVAAQAATDQWRKDRGQFVPMPSTWLNQGRWADEIPVAAAPARRQTL